MTTAIPAPVGFTDGGDAWAEWLDLAADDAKGVCTDSGATTLRHPQNLVRWQRALTALESDVNARISEARLRLESVKPQPGTPERKAWYDAQREAKSLHAGRVRFRQSINDRLIECRALLAEANIHERLTPESLLQHIARAAAMLGRDDPEAAEGLLNSVLAQAEASL